MEQNNVYWQFILIIESDYGIYLMVDASIFLQIIYFKSAKKLGKQKSYVKKKADF